MFTCSKCNHIFNHLSSYFSHFWFHYKSNNRSQVPCPVTNCPSAFSTRTALLSHYSRHHLNLQGSAISKNRMAKCVFEFCQQEFSDLKTFVNHTKQHLRQHESVKCPFKYCQKQFVNEAAFSSHIFRYHNPRTWSDLKEEHVINIGQNEQNDLTLTPETTQLYEDITENTTDESEYLDLAEIIERHSLEKPLALFYMQMQVKCLIPTRTIQSIKDEIQKICMYHKTIQGKKLKEKLQHFNLTDQHKHDILSSFLEDDEIHKLHSTSLLSAKCRSSFYRNNFVHIDPKELVVGYTESGNPLLVQYVPILDSIKQLYTEYLSYRDQCSLHTHNSSRISDVTDGLCLMEAIRGRIRAVLPNIEDEKLDKVLQRLTEIGVSTESYLRHVREDDLITVLLPIESRILLEDWKRGASVGSESTLPPPPPPPSPVPSLSQPSTSNESSMSDFDLGFTKFNIPWGDIPNKVMSKLGSKERPTPAERRKFVQIIIDKIIQVNKNPTRGDLRMVAKDIVLSYPESFADVIERTVVGTGYDSLLRQLLDRRDNIKRTVTIPLRKNTSEEKKARKRPLDSYGCVNWQPRINDEELDKEKLSVMQQNMKSLVLKRESTWETKEIEDIMDKSYPYQRQSINKGSAVRDVIEQWPILKFSKGLFHHFKLLVGRDVLETLQSSISEKSKSLMNLFEHKATTNKGTAIHSVIQEMQKEMQMHGSTVQIASAVLLTTMTYFKEDTDVLFVTQSGQNDDEGRTPVWDIPLTPCIICFGTNVVSSKKYLLAVDGNIITDKSVHSFVEALGLLFSAFYVFNISYPPEVLATMEFIQRCLMCINPEGAKLRGERKKKGACPKLLGLIEEVTNQWTRTEL